MAASRVLNASFFALPPATTPSAVIPQPRMDHVLPVAVHAQNRKGCKKSNNPLHHFLLDLLRSGEHKDIIQWTNGSSFKVGSFDHSPRAAQLRPSSSIVLEGIINKYVSVFIQILRFRIRLLLEAKNSDFRRNYFEINQNTSLYIHII